MCSRARVIRSLGLSNSDKGSMSKKDERFGKKEVQRRFETALKGARLVSPVAYEDTKKPKAIPPKSPKGRKPKYG